MARLSDMTAAGRGSALGAYGMTDELAALIAPPVHDHVVSVVAVGRRATGGTLF
jgi:hypothetical protein